MFINKNKYFLLIETIKDIDLKNIKIRNKFSIVYRNKSKIDNLDDLLSFRQKCKLKSIKFFVANNFKLAIYLNSDGIYLSSYIKDLKFLNYKKSKELFNRTELEVKEIIENTLLQLFTVYFDLARLTKEKNIFLEVIKNELENWFTLNGSNGDKQFVYNMQWDTLQGYPASFESDGELYASFPACFGAKSPSLRTLSLKSLTFCWIE